MTQPGALAGAGVAYLRNLTLRRAARGYAEWVGRAVGWWTIVYLLFWLVVFTISGIELLGRTDEPLPIPLAPAFATTLTMVFGSLVYRARSAPVFVNRRDVYRLVLSGAQPFTVLRWPFIKQWALLGFIGMFIGSAYAVVAPFWLHHQAWFAGPALALVLISHLNLSWIRYWQWDNPEADLRYLLLLPVASGFALLGIFVPGLGLTGAFASASPWSLLFPLLLAGASAYVVHRTLERTYPPRFAAQSFVLSELQAMRTSNLLAGISGVPGNDDPAYRARLLASLHDKPGVTRPTRSLRPPAAGASQWQAIGWRTLSMLWRRPLLSQGRLLLEFLLVTAVVVFAPLAGSFGLLAAAVVMSGLAAFSMGVGGYARDLPISAWHRTIGRALPAAVLAVLAAFAGDFIGLGLQSVPSSASNLMLTTAVLLSTVLWLEKYSSWTSAPARRFEPRMVAALLASAPALLLTAFGAPGLVVPVQLAILAVLLFLDV